MPIRTNRGRAAVYRRLWGWPLRSPKHLVATIVGVIVLVTTISVVIPNAVKPRSTGSQGATTSTTQTITSGGNQVGVLPSATATPLPTKAPSPTAAPSSAPVNTNAQLVADMWVDAFGSFEPGKTTKEKWLEGLKPHTSDELFPRLASIEPANVPVVIDQPVKAVKSFTDSAEFEARLEDGKLVVTVVKLPEGWRVHEFDKVG
jgi:cell division septation protein DedD